MILSIMLSSLRLDPAAASNGGGEYTPQAFMAEMKSDMAEATTDTDTDTEPAAEVSQEAAVTPASDTPAVEESRDEGIDVSFLGSRDENGRFITKPPAKGTETQTTGQPIGQQPKGKVPVNARDMTGIPENIQPLFRQMNNAAFEHLKPAYIAHLKSQEKIKSLRQQVAAAGNQRYYDSPDAWKLDPQVQSYEKNYNDLNMEMAHWKQQLVNIREGKSYQMLRFDEASGKYTLDPAEQPSAAGEVEIMDRLGICRSGQQQLQGLLGNLARNHKSQFDAVQSSLEKTDKDLFGSINWEEPNAKARYEATLNQFPATLHGRREFQMLAKGAIFIQALLQQLEQLQKGQVAAAQGAKTAQTTVKPGTNGGGSNHTSELDDDPNLFRRMKQMAGG